MADSSQLPVWVPLAGAIVGSFSLAYTVWVDRFKYSPEVAVFTRTVGDAMAVEVVNQTTSLIQLDSVRPFYGPTRRVLRSAGSRGPQLPGRVVPSILHADEVAKYSWSDSDLHARPSAIEVVVSTGQPTGSGRVVTRRLLIRV